jgi:hypothetical protein
MQKPLFSDTRKFSLSLLPLLSNTIHINQYLKVKTNLRGLSSTLEIWNKDYVISILSVRLCINSTTSEWLEKLLTIFFACGFFYPEDGGEKLLRYIGSYKTHTAPHQFIELNQRTSYNTFTCNRLRFRKRNWSQSDEPETGRRLNRMWPDDLIRSIDGWYLLQYLE